MRVGRQIADMEAQRCRWNGNRRGQDQRPANDFPARHFSRQFSRNDIAEACRQGGDEEPEIACGQRHAAVAHGEQHHQGSAGDTADPEKGRWAARRRSARRKYWWRAAVCPTRRRHARQAPSAWRWRKIPGNRTPAAIRRGTGRRHRRAETAFSGMASSRSRRQRGHGGSAKVTNHGLKTCRATRVAGKVPPKMTTPSVSKRKAGRFARYARRRACCGLLGFHGRGLTSALIVRPAKSVGPGVRRCLGWIAAAEFSPNRCGHVDLGPPRRIHRARYILSVVRRRRCRRGRADSFFRRRRSAPARCLLGGDDRAVGQDGQGRRHRHAGRDPRLPGNIRGSYRARRAMWRGSTISPSAMSPASRPMPNAWRGFAARAMPTAPCWKTYSTVCSTSPRPTGCCTSAKVASCTASPRSSASTRTHYQSILARHVNLGDADPYLRARHRARRSVRRGPQALSQARRRQSSRPADRARPAARSSSRSPRPGSPRSTRPTR